MAKNDFQYGGWNFYTLQCGTIMTLISPGDCTLYNVACGSGNMTVNSPSGSTLQRDTWLCEDMPLNSPGCSTCNVTRSSGLITLNSSGGSTLQRGSGKCIGDDMPLNSQKRPPYWNSTPGFDFDHITAVDKSYPAPFCKILSKSDHPRQKNRFSGWGSQPSWIFGVQ